MEQVIGDEYLAKNFEPDHFVKNEGFRATLYETKLRFINAYLNVYRWVSLEKINAEFYPYWEFTNTYDFIEAYNTLFPEDILEGFKGQINLLHGMCVKYSYTDKVYVKQLRPYVCFHGGMGFKDEWIPLDENIDWTNEKDADLDEWNNLFTSKYSSGWNTLEIHERYLLYEPVKSDSQ